MTPPRATSAEPPQDAAAIAAAIESFVQTHADAVVLEDGKVIFDLREAKYSLSTEHGRCTLHLWSDERNMVRRVVAATPRAGTLRLATHRFGQTQPALLELLPSRERRAPSSLAQARTAYLRLLQRALQRTFPDWKPDAFRTAMDLEKSFGPAYARGTLVRGKQAWAVIGVNEQETATTIDGILTLGILWLQACRDQAAGRRLYAGLKVIVPRGHATLTLSRMAWLNTDAAQWELWEIDQSSEEMAQLDPADHGNLRTRLVHHPDERGAAERFSVAIEQVMRLVPAGEQDRVDQRLRSAAELVFSLHGMDFARARIGVEANSFARKLEITVGTADTPLSEVNRDELTAMVAELFARRRPLEVQTDYARRGQRPSRRIGEPTARAAHARLQVGLAAAPLRGTQQQDPLYRAAPERWLESVLRRDLASLTRSLALDIGADAPRKVGSFANDPDPDTIGNRADPPPDIAPDAAREASRVLPRLDPAHVYAQVPAIAGASDRGLLDLLGVTADGRLAVIELKADEDLHFALQGLDYWIRVRHHHSQTADERSGLGEFQRHGYFTGMQLSPLPPRLYLVAPALHIHPAVETVLRYLSPRVEWHLLALDERWRSQVRVVWRKQGGR
jgi:hypothetical protein